MSKKGHQYFWRNWVMRQNWQMVKSKKGKFFRKKYGDTLSCRLV